MTLYYIGTFKNFYFNLNYFLSCLGRINRLSHRPLAWELSSCGFDFHTDRKNSGWIKEPGNRTLFFLVFLARTSIWTGRIVGLFWIKWPTYIWCFMSMTYIQKWVNKNNWRHKCCLNTSERYKVLRKTRSIKLKPLTEEKNDNCGLGEKLLERELKYKAARNFLNINLIFYINCSAKFKTAGCF